MATPGEPQQKPRVPLRLNVFTPDPATLLARARGLFAAEGFDFQMTVTPNSTEQMRGLGNGTYDVASTAFDNVLAWSGREGAEIVAVTQVADGIVLPVFVRPEIHEWSDLHGKPLAADAVDTAFALVLRRILLAHGLDMDRGDYKLVAVGATSRRLDSMKSRETFAGILNPPIDAQAAAAGMVRFGDHREVLPDYPGGVFAVSRAWAQNHQSELVGFLRAWFASILWASDPANREEAVKLLAAAQNVSPQAAAGALAQLPKDGSLNVPGLQSVLDLRTQFGFKLPMGTSRERYYDTSYHRAALGK